MASRFQAAALVASPSHPNSFAWSQENLIAVASGHLVTIMNPALPFGPRGLVTIPSSESYPIGVVKKDCRFAECVLVIQVFEPGSSSCVQSISWSHVGMASNSGCLLAVCTTEGRVKLFRPPFCDFCAEWIEVMDVTDKLYGSLSSISFGESDDPSSGFSMEQATEHCCADDEPISILRKERKQRRQQALQNFWGPIIISGNSKDVDTGFNSSNVREGQRVPKVSEIKSYKLERKRKVVNKIPENFAQTGLSNSFSLLAVCAKSGKLSLWRVHAPECYYIEHSNVSTTVILIGLLQAHSSWVTTMSWGLLDSDSSRPQVLLDTGSSDGSINIWLGYGEELLKSSEVNNSPLFLLKEVVTLNTISVSVLSVIVPTQSQQRMHLAIGKGSGSFEL